MAIDWLKIISGNKRFRPVVAYVGAQSVYVRPRHPSDIGTSHHSHHHGDLYLPAAIIVRSCARIRRDSRKEHAERKREKVGGGGGGGVELVS